MPVVQEILVQNSKFSLNPSRFVVILLNQNSGKQRVHPQERDDLSFYKQHVGIKSCPQTGLSSVFLSWLRIALQN